MLYDYRLKAEPIVEKSNPCTKQCAFVYKTRIDPEALSLVCSRGCGAKMKVTQLSKEISEVQNY